jgi:hypothetical protein
MNNNPKSVQVTIIRHKRSLYAIVIDGKEQDTYPFTLHGAKRVSS